MIAASLLLSLPLAAAVQKVSLNSDGRVAAWQLRAQDEVPDAKAMLGAGYDASGWVAAVVPPFFSHTIILCINKCKRYIISCSIEKIEYVLYCL